MFHIVRWYFSWAGHEICDKLILLNVLNQLSQLLASKLSEQPPHYYENGNQGNI